MDQLEAGLAPPGCRPRAVRFRHDEDSSGDDSVL